MFTLPLLRTPLARRQDRLERKKPSPWMAYSVIAASVLLALAYAGSLLRIPMAAYQSPITPVLIWFQAAVEIGVSFYAFAAIFCAIAYLLLKERVPGQKFVTPAPPVGILYLCCDDLDRGALESLLTLEYRGVVHLVIHDDSKSPESRASVDQAVDQLRCATRFHISLLRRPRKEGGKAGALNYVLQQTGHLYQYFILCDNDTTVVDRQAIEKALTYFQDEGVAIVQCRSVAVDSPEYCALNRLLSRSIDIFDLFLTVSSRFGWRPFIGHNAVLRTSAVLEVGGFTPDFFSDDLDLTIRLNLQGYAVVYAQAVRIGEKHPPSYDAFRSRTYKWSYGCMQMLKTHAKTVLTSSQFSLAEKVSFFYFTGFYVGQTILLIYLTVRFLITPFFRAQQPFSPADLIVGTMLVVLIYLPNCAYFLKQRSLRTSLGTLAACGLVYGTTDFACIAAVWDCLRGKKRRWIPTNSAQQECDRRALWLEALFGLVLFLVPLLVFPSLLYMPCAYVFVGKFLFGPTVSLLYRDMPDANAVTAAQAVAA
jgi:glycosyl transferase family 2